MTIKLIVVGKTKQSYFQEAEAEYKKRLSSFMVFEETVLKPHSNESGQNTDVIIEREGEDILKKIDAQDFVVALSEDGVTYTSEDLADKLEQWQEHYGVVTVVIGGTFGLSEQVKNRAQVVLSLSRMTFTHEMIRTVLMEQLYRAYTIINNTPYHY